MAAGRTYTPIATTTLGSAASSVSLGGIPQTYTDLVIVATATSTSNAGISLRFNGDSGSNYSRTVLEGNGTAASSERESNVTGMSLGISRTSEIPANIFQIMNYSNSTTNKTALARQNAAGVLTRAIVGLWRNTATITSINIYPTAGDFNSGSTFTLYGIAAA